MHPDYVPTGWDAALFAAPFFALLGAWMFGLDELIAAPRRKRRSRRVFCHTSLKGHSLPTDPDGRPWKLDSAHPRRAAHSPGSVENSHAGNRARTHLLPWE